MPELYSRHRLTIVDPGQELFAALAALVPELGRRQAREAIVAGLVTVDGVIVGEPKFTLPATAAVEVDLRQGIRKARLLQKHGAPPGQLLKPFTILHEDPDLVVVDKAAGVLSAPTEAGEHGHVPELLRQHWRALGREPRFIGRVHRLDRDTSGCLCFAMTREAQRLLGAQFAGESATRTYRCLVMGDPPRNEGTITGGIGRDKTGKRAVVDDDQPAKSAVTHYKVLRRFPLGAELEVRLETGRTHQIRIHLQTLGCPVYGDRIYPQALGARRKPLPDAPRPPRLMLHAAHLALDHPRTGQRLTVAAPEPKEWADFVALLARPRQPVVTLAARPAPERPARPAARPRRRG